MLAAARRAAQLFAAVVGAALIAGGCGHADKSAEPAPSASAGTGSPTPTTQITGANGAAYTVQGPILAKYESLPANARKDLGAPTGNEQKNPDGGSYQQFDGGVIVFKSQAYVVWGAIRDKWNQMGGSQGQLGYPTSDEVDTPDGRKKSTFEHGAITWTPGGAGTTPAACIAGLDPC